MIELEPQISLELIMISDKGLHLFRNPPAGHDLGELIAYTDIFSAFSSPIIILFMGGFALAIAARLISSLFC